MKKEDLKTGQIVELFNGEHYLVLKNTFYDTDVLCHSLGCTINLSLIKQEEIKAVYEHENLYDVLMFREDSTSTPKAIYKKPQIEVTVKINGKEAKLSDISDETWQKIRSIN